LIVTRNVFFSLKSQEYKFLFLWILSLLST